MQYDSQTDASRIHLWEWYCLRILTVISQIGNAHFTWFGTTASKNRVNFFALLRAGYADYIINDEAFACAS
jgi:hypothetical protein